MPPEEKPKTKIKITKRFTDEQGGRLYAPGEWDVHPAVAHRLIAQGKAARIGGATVPAAPAKTNAEKAPATNPRIPEKKVEEPVTDTPLPEDFPNRGALIVAGFGTVEKLKAPGVKEALGEVKELTPADITKIGLAISKI